LESKHDIPGLIKALDNKNKFICQEALAALERIGDVRAVEPLMARLININGFVEQGMSDGLCRIGAPVVEPLIAALKDSNKNVRKGAASVLGKIGDTRALEPLIAALTDNDKFVRQSAVEALGKMGAAGVEPLIAALKDSDGNVRQSAVEALGKMGAAGVEPLIAALKDSDGNVRQKVVQVLGETGAPAVEPLLAALQDSDGYIRRMATIVLGEIGAKLKDTALRVRAVEPLIAALHDSDGRVRWVAAGALGKIDAKLEDHALRARAVDPLIAVLQDSNQDARKEAANALGEIGDARALEPLIAVLQDSNQDVRRKAAEALGKIGTQLEDDALRVRAVEPLIAALKDRGARTEAAGALDKLNWKPGNDQTGAYYWCTKRDWSKCYSIGTLAVEPLIDVLNDRDAAQQVPLQEAGVPADNYERGVLQVMDALETKLQGLKAKDRRNAAFTLGLIGDARAVEPLIAALQFGDKHMHESVADALILIDRPAMEQTIAVLKMRDNYLRQHVIETLEKTNPSISKAIQAALQQSDLKKESTPSTKASTPLTKWAPEQSYFFICSGNASLIDSYNNLFKVGAPAYHGTAGHYYAGIGDLGAREQEASKASLPFVGQCYMDTKSTPMSQMQEVLRAIEAEASREVHIAFVSVDPTGVAWVQKVYSELLKQAVSQDILPYEMYVTKDNDASQFLLSSFNKIS